MFINEIKKAGESANIDDLVNLLSVKMYLPFTTDLLDKSLSTTTVTNNGNVVLGSEGAVFNGTQNSFLQTSYYFVNGKKVTIEVLLKCSSFVTKQFIMRPNGDGQVLMWVESNYLRISNVSTGTPIFQFVVTPYINKMFHIAVVNDTTTQTAKFYIDGVLIDSKPFPFTSMPYGYLIGAVNPQAGNFPLSGIIGGLKFTEQLLEPYQFSLLRPMELKYPSFVVGEKEYIYKGGVFNPKYQPTVNNFTNVGGKLINGSQLSIPYAIANKKCFVEGTILSAIGSYKQIYLYYSTTTSLPNNYGKNTIYFPNADGYPFSFGFSLDSDKFISLTCNQSVLEITKIWIE